MGLSIFSPRFFFEGYPLAIFFIIGILGLLLVIIRPYSAFLLSVFALAARNYHAAVFTRLPGIGRYLNLNDLLLWICVLAFLAILLTKTRLWAPRILIAIFILNIIGACVAIVQYGFIPLVLQTIWWAFTFPIMFLVAANLVVDESKAKFFYWALFVGALLSAFQHFVSIEGQIIETDIVSPADLKMISYIMSGGIFLACGAIFIDMRKIIKSLRLYIFWIIGISLITLSYVLSLTRTVWIGAIFSIAGLFVSTRKIDALAKRKIYVVLMVFVLMFSITLILLPSRDLESILLKQTRFLYEQDVFESSYFTRKKSIDTDLRLWLNSPIIFGRGTTLPPKLVIESQTEGAKVGVGALGHVGFSTYLSHFGLIGLVVYWILLPLLTIKIARKICWEHPKDYVGVLALAAAALAFFDLIATLSSHHYLGSTSHVEGLIYGSIWGLSRINENKNLT